MSGTSWFVFNEVINSGLDIHALFDNSRFALEKLEILQMMPASGITALFSDGDPQPIQCWALRRETWMADGEQRVFERVVGMIIVEGAVGLQFVDGPDCAGFAGYGR